MKSAIGSFMLILGIALLCNGCSTYYSAGSYSDDIYASHDTKAIAAAAYAQGARDYQRSLEVAQAAAKATTRVDQGVVAGESTGNPYQDILSDSYRESYERRQRGFESPTYNMPDSYYAFRYSDESNYASAYDPSLYNVIVMGDEVWVEPKYITAMFGSWGTSQVNINLNWGGYWGWNYPYYSYCSPYWGSSYYNGGWGWNCGWGWNYPYWGYDRYYNNNYYYGGGYSYYDPRNTTHRSNYGSAYSGTYRSGNSGYSTRRPSYGSSGSNYGSSVTRRLSYGSSGSSFGSGETNRSSTGSGSSSTGTRRNSGTNNTNDSGNNNTDSRSTETKRSNSSSSQSNSSGSNSSRPSYSSPSSSSSDRSSSGTSSGSSSSGSSSSSGRSSGGGYGRR